MAPASEQHKWYGEAEHNEISRTHSFPPRPARTHRVVPAEGPPAHHRCTLGDPTLRHSGAFAFASSLHHPMSGFGSLSRGILGAASGAVGVGSGAEARQRPLDEVEQISDWAKARPRSSLPERLGHISRLFDEEARG